MNTATSRQVLTQMGFRQKVREKWREPHTRRTRLFGEPAVNGFEAQAQCRTVAGSVDVALIKAEDERVTA